MRCPECGEKTDVKDSRPRDDGNLRRRRWCPACGLKFSTVEVVAYHKREGRSLVLHWKGSEAAIACEDSGP